MQVQVQPIRLSVAQPTERLVKRGALTFFRVVRSVVDHSKEVPGLLEQAAHDVRQAWEESSRPNA
jgi:hypothetical protein